MRNTTYKNIILASVFILFSIWFGGFTFYAAVVIPIGTEVIGSTEQGFITQQVSNWLNGIGGIALIGLAWLAFRIYQHRGFKWLWFFLCISWLLLLILHPVLDRFLLPGTYEVADPEEFYGWHRIYLLIHTIQWLASLGIWGFWANQSVQKLANPFL
ncbi:MAG: hypothetical protein AAF694_31250 [Bacteroidota bacterium]